MQQKYLQVVLEEELKAWWREGVQQRKGEALSLFSRDLGLHLNSELRAARAALVRTGFWQEEDEAVP